MCWLPPRTNSEFIPSMIVEKDSSDTRWNSHPYHSITKGGQKLARNTVLAGWVIVKGGDPESDAEAPQSVSASVSVGKPQVSVFVCLCLRVKLGRTVQEGAAGFLVGFPCNQDRVPSQPQCWCLCPQNRRYPCWRVWVWSSDWLPPFSSPPLVAGL